MSSPQASILVNHRCRALADAHARQLAKQHGASVDVLCVDDESDVDSRVDAMCAEWSAFRRELNIATRFNDPERVIRGLVVTAKSDDPQDGLPYVVLARSGESKALLVGVVDRPPIARLPGPFHDLAPRTTRLESPETGLLVNQGSEAPALCASIVQSALRAGVADRVLIQNLPAENAAYASLTAWDALGARGATESKIRWWATLLDPETGERVDKHSGKTRANLRKRDRRFVEAFDGDVELECITRSDQIDQFVADAVSIIRQTYQAALGIGVQDTDAYRALLREMADAGSLRGYVMRGRGAPIAYVLGDRWDDSFTLWALSFDPEHRKLAPGIVTLRRVMESLAAEGVARFDFGWGHAEYKKKLGDHHVDEVDISLHSKRPLPTMAFVAASATRAARARADQVITELGIRDRVKKLWRKKLAMSSRRAE